MSYIQELLERAAKEAGYKADVGEAGELCVEYDVWEVFRPDLHDSQAFRLMVDCGIGVEFFRNNVWAMSNDASGARNEEFSNHNNDKLAATRMAILRAAAGVE